MECFPLDEVRTGHNRSVVPKESLPAGTLFSSQGANLFRQRKTPVREAPASSQSIRVFEAQVPIGASPIFSGRLPSGDASVTTFLCQYSLCNLPVPEGTGNHPTGKISRPPNDRNPGAELEFRGMRMP